MLTISLRVLKQVSMWMLWHRAFRAATLQCFGRKLLFWKDLGSSRGNGGTTNYVGLEAIKKRHLFNASDADVIRNAYRLRTIAHYRTEPLSVKQVERLLRRSKEFVQKAKEVT